MELSELTKLNTLVVDDFPNFRATITGMLKQIGFTNIIEASRGQDALRMCKARRFDLILSDYNLGAGMNGQQLLEELRYRKYINRNTSFCMITAEAGKDLVLSAYDCQPDDYLMKPMNLRVLQQRLKRLLLQRKVLADAYRYIDTNNSKKAIASLEKVCEKLGRHQLIAQKLLGEQYLEVGDWQKAEKLYTQALENHQLDWAMLGLAKAKDLKGERKEAKATLNKLIEGNKLFLPAYDELVNLHQKAGDLESAQKELIEVTNVSPRSILRQRKLAEVASENADLLVALDASMEALKLGETSCYKDANDNLIHLEAMGNAMECNLLPDASNTENCKKCMENLKQSKILNNEEEGRAKLLAARIYALEGKTEEAKKLAEQEALLCRSGNSGSIERNLARYNFLCTVGEFDQADQLVDELLSHHKNNSEAMQKLDKLLPEPRSEENRKRVAELNKTGINYYQQGGFNLALEYFFRATVMYPRHIGIQLNLLQSLLGKIKLYPDDRNLQKQIKRQMDKTASLIKDPNSAHYSRFDKLREKAIGVLG